MVFLEKEEFWIMSRRILKQIRKTLNTELNYCVKTIKQGINSNQELLEITEKDLPEHYKRYASNIVETDLKLLLNKGKIVQRGNNYLISKK